MDRINIYDGGHEMSPTDLEFLQGFLRDALIGLGKMFGDNYIVSGCERSNWTIMGDIEGVPTPIIIGYTFAPGYVVINGELCKFNGANVDNGSYPTSSFVIQEAAQSPQVVYEDATSKDVYFHRRAVIVGTGSNLPTFDKSRYLVKPTAWEFPDFKAGIFASGNPIRVRRVDGCLEFQGDFIITTAVTGNLTQTPLPEYLRPVYDVRAVAHIYPEGGTAESVLITLSAGGHITLPTDFTSGEGKSVYLNGLRIPLELSFG